MVRSTSAMNLLCPILVGGLAGQLGCEPTPDYRVSVLDIPANAAVLLFGWKSNSDVVSSKSLAVPVADLDSDARSRYTVAVNIDGAPDESGVLSLATVNSSGCITSVVSADSAPRSSSTSVTQLELELDPNVNPNVVQRAVLPSPLVQCPPNPPFPPYPDPESCPKVPGLATLPTEPTVIPTRPVVINTLRQLRGPARAYDSGKMSFYGWGFDRGTLGFGVTCDPSKCFQNLQMKYPQYTTMLLAPPIFRYPSLSLVSYSQLDLQVSQLKSTLKVDPASGVQDDLILCIAVSAVSFTFQNPDGYSASYSEVLPK